MNLTRREYQVLALLANGMNVRQTAIYLGLAEQTVKNEIGSAYKRMRVVNRYQAFMELGWLTPPNLEDMR